MRKAADVVVVGAGIFGLSCAWACALRGRRVLVLDRAGPGAGASGGPVGALCPHLPEPWSAKQAFQLGALLAAEAHWRAVAAAGGRDPGYARIGRLIPLASPAERARAEARAAAARRRWPASAAWTLLPPAGLPETIAPAAAPEGAVLETLSARIDPVRAVAALAAALCARGVEIRGGCAVTAVEDGAVRGAFGRLTAEAVIVAAGSALLPPGLGQAIKGQAARLAPSRPLAGPMLASDGLFVVPHADGTVGVGATSEADWRDPAATDARLDAVIARARALCPPLADAAVIARWAGLRPRGPRPDPLLGRLPGHARTYLATGGFRIGFGIAHAVGAALADMLDGGDPGLPPGFAVAAHLAASRRLPDI